MCVGNILTSFLQTQDQRYSLKDLNGYDMNRVTGDYVLYVDDVTIKVKDTTILQGVKFTAKTGDLLAILGPTGT